MKTETRWVETRHRKRPELKKGKAGRGISEFRHYYGHVACDSTQGFTHSARGTDGPTQQNLCAHACAFILHYLLDLFIYLPVQACGG